ncbi:MAG: transporter, family, putative rane transport protein, partial [Mycobacterium sp.]|nr:transporter, family, putative rane transport protein [Mycobacterium sp.]
AHRDRAEAAALYLFSYYLGGSVAGALGGVVYSVGGWPSTVLFVGALLSVGWVLVALLAWGKDARANPRTQPAVAAVR